MNQNFLNYLANKTGINILNAENVSGGDISSAFKLNCKNKESYFLKVNKSNIAFSMFETEKKGLNTLSSCDTIATPKVFLTGKFQNISFILMEFIENKSCSKADYISLAQNLTQLHQIKFEEFGLDYDNFIGNLKQKNNFEIDWVKFYTEYRIVPQLQMAYSRNLLNVLPDTDNIFNSLKDILIEVYPSIIHGDLWSGNYLIDYNGIPYLIDPAVYYGDRIIDIAMSKLFGGFDNIFYETYFSETENNVYNLNEKIEIYQLYYLLVHLNIFGLSYKNAVINIIKKYF